MKKAKIEVQFSTAVLANGIATDGKRDHFSRDALKNLLFKPAWWHAALRTAVEMSGVRGLSVSDIHMNLAVPDPGTTMVKHVYDGGERRHETIPPGAKVVFEALVSDSVDKSSLSAVFGLLGSYIGLSPHGHNLGFGRFTLLDVTLEDLSPADAGHESTIRREI